MDHPDKEYHCEDCRNFDETKIPADCLQGLGMVAFRHPICPEFKLLRDVNIDNEGAV